jgi:hypothetical protein
MRDYFLDIIQNTYKLGSINLVKITGTDSSTVIEAMSEDRAFVVHARTNNPVPEFIGVFGLPNLGQLNTILNIPEYAEDAKLSITYKKTEDGSDVPDGLHLENARSDFSNDYRFMSKELVSDKLKSVKMREVTWDLEFEPQVASIQRLKFQASANSGETLFTAKTENGDLKFYFGDHSTHAGNFVFQSGCQGKLNKPLSWPVAVVLNILSLPGDKVMKISNDAVIQITVNSGVATYDYKIPVQCK